MPEYPRRCPGRLWFNFSRASRRHRNRLYQSSHPNVAAHGKVHKISEHTRGPDSAVCNIGFVKGLRKECSAVGLHLGSSTDPLKPFDVTFAVNQWGEAQERGVSVDCDPRSCPSSGAAACTYRMWFQHSPTQPHVLGGSLHSHARSSSRAHQLVRFRLGCHGLPCVVGRRTGTPRHLRCCTLCHQGVGDEKHLVFECTALNHIRSHFQHLFCRGYTMSLFMNQDALEDVMYFVTDCLQFYSDNVPS